MARKMSVVLDTSMLQGVSGNNGIPGLVDESGFVTRHYTGDSGTSGHTPGDTGELSVIAEVTRKANAVVTAFVSNPQVYGTFNRITSGSYPMWVPASR